MERMAAQRGDSKSEVRRQKGLSQIASRRQSILDTSERIFLEQGLERTTMADIARGEGITAVTLYRYFPSRDPIAFEIAARKMHEIAASIGVVGDAASPATIRQIAIGLIDHFEDVRDAYRYMGMFDHLYGDRYPDEKLAAWYKNVVLSLEWGGLSFQVGSLSPDLRQRVMVMMNSIVCYLQKMAARGELLSGEQGIPLEKQLSLFKDMIAVALDRLEQ